MSQHSIHSITETISGTTETTTPGFQVNDEMGTPGPIGNAYNQQQQNPLDGAKGQTNAPNVLDYSTISKRFVIPTAISSKGETFIEEFNKYIEGVATALPIKVTKLSNPAGAMVIHQNNQAVILLFSEAATTTDYPTSAYGKQALESMTFTLGETVRLRNCIVITPADYPKPTQMAAQIVNTLIALNDPEITMMTIESFKNYNITPVLNRNIYDSFAASHAPHGLTARNDLVLTLMNSISNRNYNNEYNVNIEHFKHVELEREAFAAVSAYTSFIDKRIPEPNTRRQFIPVIHLTDIISSIPHRGMLPLILAYAKDIFIDQRRWRDQFNNIRDGGVNIGNLILDPSTSAPFMVKNLAERDQFIDTYCTNPVMVIHCTEGRARIAGLELYAVPNHGNFIIDSYQEFLGGTLQTSILEPCRILEMNYIGAAKHNGQEIDSRYFDYLNMVITHSHDLATVAQLLQSYTHPKEGVALLKHFAKDSLNFYYTDYQVVLDGNIMNAVQQAVHSNVRTTYENTQGGTINNIDFLSGVSSALSQPLTFGGMVGNNVAPYSAIWSQNGLQSYIF